MSDPLPFKLRILHALTDSLKQIVPGNGFVSNMADFADGDGVNVARVYRGRLWFGESDPVPMLSVLEGTAPADEAVEPSTAESAWTEYDWPLIVQGFLADDPLNPTDPGYVLLADVRQRLAYEAGRKAGGVATYPDPLGLGRTEAGSVLKLTFGSGTVRPADEISAKAYFWLSLNLRIIERPTLPYA